MIIQLSRAINTARQHIGIGLFFLALSASPVQSQTNSVTVIPLKAVAGLRYDQVRFRVKPGTTVRIVLSNEDEMSHNLVITEPGAREEVVHQALALGEKGPAMNYIPESAKVRWAISLVDPGQSSSITFTVPDKEGIYPYVCTFPGHGAVMFGAMYVTDGTLPPLKDDPNIPALRESTRKESDKKHDHYSNHPYVPVAPYLYRILMPDAGPAAIAVCLPKKLAYCWDAGACRLRYAWAGDFIDPVDYWDKKGELSAKILGTIFYRDKTKFPLRVGDVKRIPDVRFKGYRLVNAYPEFHYTINELDIYEIILPKEDGTGLERTFRIPNVTTSIWFITDPSDGVQYSTSDGKFVAGRLSLSSVAAQHFTITMTRVKGAGL